MTREAIFLKPGAGRAYPMGRMHAVFKADGAETRQNYSVSEWWLEPRTIGPHQHFHEDDHVYYVIEGVLNVQLNDAWSEAPQGSYILIPGGTPHGFENRGFVRTGFISFNAPGGFEERMQHIAPALASTDLSM